MQSKRLMPYFVVAIMLSIGARSSIMAQVPGPDVNVSDMPGYQGEVGIALNPTDPLNAVVVTNELIDLTKLGVWYTTDGGETWTANFVDENADGFSGNDIRFDPNVAFDSDGNVYIVYSTSGAGSRVAVVRSSDGGQTYDQVAVATTDAGSSRLHTAMVTTRSADGPDSVLVVYARVQGIESVEASLSVDAGASFPTHNTFINDVLQRTFLPWAVADAAGDFHVVWEVELNNSGTGIIQHDLLDGVTLADSANNTTVTTIQITDFANATSEIPPQPDRGIFSVATVDVDRATGRLYLSYTDRPNNQSDDTDIYVRFSDNNGADWSDRIQINDDDTTTSQFMPRLVVDQTTGVIAAIWYDARDDEVNNGLVDIFTSVSHDGAASWSGNQRVTTARSNESVSNPLRDARNYLEYIGFSVHAGVGYVSWTDARDDNFRSGTNEDIYSAVIFLSSTADPLEFSAFRGSYVSGDLGSLLESDDDKLCYNPGVVLMPTEAPITLDFVGTLPNDAPSILDVTIESTANTVGLGLTISFWNFNTDSWDVVGTAAQSLNDDVARTFAGIPADHVEPGTGEVRTRYEVRQEGPLFLFPWLDCVDHIFWTFN